MKRLESCCRTSAAVALVLLAGCGSVDEHRTSLLSGLGALGHSAEPSQTIGQQSLDMQLSLARTLEQQGDLERAAQIYRETIDQHPTSAAGHHRLAVVYDQQGLFEESSELFRKALSLQPGDPSICCDYGYSLYLQRRWDEAEVQLRKAVSLRPDDRRAHNHLGMLLAQTDRPEEALTEFRKSGCTTAEAHLNTAFICLLDDRFSEASEEYQLALDAAPASPSDRQKLHQLGRVLAGLPESVSPAAAIELTRGQHSLPPSDERKDFID